MAMIKCPTGWLVVPSEEASSGYVPFFIQVRNEDIHWKEDPEFKSVISNITDNGSDSVSVIHPGSVYRIDRNKWSIEIQSDGLTTMTKQISINDVFTLIDNNTILTGIVNLPVFIRKDNFFNIQVTLSPANDDIQYANANATGIETSINIDGDVIHGYKSFKLNLTSFIYRFTESFVNDYKDSKIFVTVRGFIPVTNQPIIDDNNTDDSSDNENNDKEEDDDSDNDNTNTSAARLKSIDEYTLKDLHDSYLTADIKI